jgi:hypothetical protein
VLVVTPYLLLLLGAIVPRVEDPLPDEIGLSVVLILAGSGPPAYEMFCLLP